MTNKVKVTDYIDYLRDKLLVAYELKNTTDDRYAEAKLKYESKLINRFFNKEYESSSAWWNANWDIGAISDMILFLRDEQVKCFYYRKNSIDFIEPHPELEYGFWRWLKSKKQ